MKTKFNGILTLLIALSVQFVFAQKTVSGTVSDEAGPLPGVNILIKGTTSGTQTDFDGNYTLMASEGQTLVFSYVGYDNVEKVVGASSVYDVMMTGGTVLDEVVVTALGIKKSDKSIGYAAQKVKSEDLTTVRDANVVNSLSGKIAGVSVTNANNGPGSSSRIILRGVSTIYGDAQPLIVVDGMPIDNNSYGNASSNGGNDVPNGLADINQDDIETLNVLKGGPATALYGMRGANGVIVITTKSGKGLGNSKKLGITINSTVGFTNISFLPDYQNSYGEGNNLEYFEYKDGYGTTNAYTSGLGGLDESWGPPLDAGLEFIQWNSFDGEPTPWVSAPDGVRNFYNTGITVDTNLALEGSGDLANYRLSLGLMDQTGVMHNTDYKKYNVGGSVNFDLSDKWDAGINFNYIKASSDNIPSQGYDTNTNNTQTAQLVWAARQIDFADLRDWRSLPLNTTGVNAGSPLNWNQAYNNNPFWALEKNTNGLEKDRVIGNVNISHQLLENVSINLKTGIDYFTSLNSSRAAFGTAGNEFGYYKETNRTRYEINSEALISYNTSITEDLDFSLNVGGNLMSNNYHRNYIEAPQLQLPGVYNISNTKDGVTPVISQSIFKRKINSVFGMGQFAYRNYLFLDFTGRNDWASVLPLENNSFFYPSVSLSAVLSDIFDLKNDYITFLKLRGGWAKVGSAGPLEPYSLASSFEYSGDPWGTTPIALLPGTLWNPNIKNQSTYEYELGLDGRFFQNRLTVDFTYYDKTTEDVILPVSKSGASGFTSAWDNAATIYNKGVELNLSSKILKSDNGLNLGIDLNFGKNINEVNDIDSDPDSDEGAITLGGLWEVDIQAREGQPIGVIYGPAFARNDDGEIIYEDGLPLYNPTYQILGNTTPDWTGGLGLNMSFRKFSFSTLFDVKMGGELYSQTNSWGKYAGVLQETLEGREDGVVGQGVVNVGTEEDPIWEANNTVVGAEEFYKAFFTTDVAEPSVYDASYVKWRELALSYSLPKNLIAKTGFYDVNVGFNVRNLAILYKKVPHIDPETSFGNSTGTQGLEYAQIPPTRTYAFSLNLKF